MTCFRAGSWGYQQSQQSLLRRGNRGQWTELFRHPVAIGKEYLTYACYGRGDITNNCCVSEAANLLRSSMPFNPKKRCAGKKPACLHHYLSNGRATQRKTVHIKKRTNSRLLWVKEPRHSQIDPATKLHLDRSTRPPRSWDILFAVPLQFRYVIAGNTGTKPATGVTPYTDPTGCCPASMCQEFPQAL